ncbi:hypothetical protein [Actinotalea sp. Marseille-Q4924]|uniref:hypothetical protein n=1 Tax=Actinotalea sp. Marseille-Q4924 TaxID=2866571 RepID=UPI001CE3C9C4|nr:hypothetical protein [Actinotalea sp. Marseille-Q4924]
MQSGPSASWDLAGRLHVRSEGLDPAQQRAVTAELDPFEPGPPNGSEPDLLLGRLARPELVEVQGPAKDRLTTAVDRDGRLLARYGGHWIQVPAPRTTPVHLHLEPGLAVRSCWRELVRPAAHQALRATGSVALHGAAVDDAGEATVISGWSETGKTEVALAMVEAGAHFLSDKWTVAGVDGQVSAFPVGVGVRGWVLPALPTLRASLPPRARLRLGAARAARVTALPALDRARGVRVLARGSGLAAHAVELGDRAGLSPSELRTVYGQSDDPGRRSRLSTLVVLLTGADDRVRAEEAPPEWAAQRLARTAAYERRTYYDLQERGAYAGLPGRAGARDAAVAEEESFLTALLDGGVRVLRVTCPFPGDPRRVAEAVAALR